MRRRFILTASERSGLLAIPTDETELIRLYTLSEQDLSAIRQRRGDANRLGFAGLPSLLVPQTSVSGSNLWGRGVVVIVSVECFVAGHEWDVGLHSSLQDIKEGKRLG